MGIQFPNWLLAGWQTLLLWVCEFAKRLSLAETQ